MNGPLPLNQATGRRVDIRVHRKTSNVDDDDDDEELSVILFNSQMTINFQMYFLLQMLYLVRLKHAERLSKSC